MRISSGRSPRRRLLGIENDAFQIEQLVEGDGAEGAQHEQRAMGEVDDAERSEDQREPQRDQRIGAALVQPVQYLQQYRVHSVLALEFDSIASTEWRRPPFGRPAVQSRAQHCLGSEGPSSPPNIAAS